MAWFCSRAINNEPPRAGRAVYPLCPPPRSPCCYLTNASSFHARCFEQVSHCFVVRVRVHAARSSSSLPHLVPVARGGQGGSSRYTHTHTYIHTHTYMHMHTYAHTHEPHTHTHTRAASRLDARRDTGGGLATAVRATICGSLPPLTAPPRPCCRPSHSSCFSPPFFFFFFFVFFFFAKHGRDAQCAAPLPCPCAWSTAGARRTSR